MPLLEIEQKFSFTLATLARFTTLTSKCGFPPFKSPDPIDLKIFRDTYYDSQCKLSNAGLWLRKRHHQFSSHPHRSDGGVEWELKQSVQGGSFLRSTFSETKDRSRILELVRSHFPDRSLGFEDDFAGLDAIAGFETQRLSLRAHDRFTVVMDVTDFGHRVGEVELMAEDVDAEKAHADIEAFLREYPGFFDTSNPKGKLTAYFENFGYPKEET